MKNILLLTAILFFGSAAFAQTGDAKKAEAKTEKKETKFCCPKCDYCSAKAGTCPHHKVALVGAETETKYCCSHDDWTIAPVKGNCPHSTASLYKDGTLYCVVYHDKGGKCPKCGMDM